jgi:HK97 family phage portal protein
VAVARGAGRAQGRDLIYRIDGRDVLPARDVLHIKGFGINGVVGYMLAQVGKESLGLTLAAQRFAANYYANGTRFTGLISHPKVMSPEAYKRLEQSFNENHAGVDRAHGTKVLEEGVTWTKTSADANEAQMLEARQFQVEDVARWLRMPPHKIGHLERAQGWSTLESANTDYVIDTLMPWLVRWEQECQRKLIGRRTPTCSASTWSTG